jgi:transposase
MERNEIARMLPCSPHTATLWTHRWQEERSLSDAERSGRPRCTDDDTDQRIADFAEEQKFATPRQITAALHLPCTARTTRRRLDEAGLHGRVARSVPMWTPEHIRKRLSFAEGYARWTAADWESVIFSDETHIELNQHGQVWVQRPVGAAFDPQYVAPHKLHSGRVTLWGCFCAKEIGQAEVFVGEFDAVKYTDVLAHNLLPSARAFFPSGQ